jgi:hypothetical protein
MADRLSLTNALTEANIPRPEAERIATEILDLIHENVATKADLQNVETALKADIAASELRLRTEIANLRADLWKWTGGAVIVIIGAVAALLKLLH